MLEDEGIYFFLLENSLVEIQLPQRIIRGGGGARGRGMCVCLCVCAQVRVCD